MFFTGPCEWMCQSERRSRFDYSPLKHQRVTLLFQVFTSRRQAEIPGARRAKKKARSICDQSGRTRIGWRRGGDSNPRSHKGSRDFESRRLNLTPEPLRVLAAFMFAAPRSR